jgi:hypothetical protein
MYIYKYIYIYICIYRNAWVGRESSVVTESLYMRAAHLLNLDESLLNSDTNAEDMQVYIYVYLYLYEQKQKTFYKLNYIIIFIFIYIFIYIYIYQGGSLC